MTKLISSVQGEVCVRRGEERTWRGLVRVGREARGGGVARSVRVGVGVRCVWVGGEDGSGGLCVAVVCV